MLRDHHGDSFRALLPDSEPIEAFKVTTLIDRHLKAIPPDADPATAAEVKDRALEEVRPLIERVPADRLDRGVPLREYLLWLAADRVGVDCERLREWWGWTGERGAT